MVPSTSLDVLPSNAAWRYLALAVNAAGGVGDGQCDGVGARAVGVLWRGAGAGSAVTEVPRIVGDGAVDVARRAAVERRVKVRRMRRERGGGRRCLDRGHVMRDGGSMAIVVGHGQYDGVGAGGGVRVLWCRSGAGGGGAEGPRIRGGLAARVAPPG